MTFDFSEFKNKKIIVTGSSTGIGFETGVEFLNLGANVIFHGNQSLSLIHISEPTRRRGSRMPSSA